MDTYCINDNLGGKKYSLARKNAFTRNKILAKYLQMKFFTYTVDSEEYSNVIPVSFCFKLIETS